MTKITHSTYSLLKKKLILSDKNKYKTEKVDKISAVLIKMHQIKENIRDIFER